MRQGGGGSRRRLWRTAKGCGGTLDAGCELRGAFQKPVEAEDSLTAGGQGIAAFWIFLPCGRAALVVWGAEKTAFILVSHLLLLWFFVATDQNDANKHLKSEIARTEETTSNAPTVRRRRRRCF